MNRKKKTSQEKEVSKWTTHKNKSPGSTWFTSTPSEKVMFNLMNMSLPWSFNYGWYDIHAEASFNVRGGGRGLTPLGRSVMTHFCLAVGERLHQWDFSELKTNTKETKNYVIGCWTAHELRKCENSLRITTTARHLDLNFFPVQAWKNKTKLLKRTVHIIMKIVS